MLLFNSCIRTPHIQSHHLLLHLFSMIITSLKFIFFLILLIPRATPLNFDLPEITSHQNNVPINTYAESYISSEGLRLTPNQPNEPGLYWPQTAGRATYAQPLHLWDKASGNLSSFQTHFCFSIDSGQSSVYGDGLAFFLLPNDFVPLTPGGALGLPVNGSQPFPFLAVEFDTWWNDWDPRFSPETHVGININSLKSVAASVWYNNITHGEVNEAWISYSYDTKILSVGFTGFLNHSSVTQHNLSYAVDLRDYLPEWVALGFSASTCAASENHIVYSWSFSSNMAFTPSPSGTTSGGRRNESPPVVLVWAVAIMLSVLVIGLL